MSSRYLLLTAAVVIGAACTDVRQLLALNREMITRFGLPMDLSLSRNRLRIKLTNVPAGEDSSPRRTALAHAIAMFAAGHYPKGSSLDDVAVIFERSGDVAGVTIHSTIAQYRWTGAELVTRSSSGIVAAPAATGGAPKTSAPSRP